MEIWTLKDLLDTQGKERVEEILSTFFCSVEGYPATKAVENFIKKSAIVCDAQNFTRSHLLFNDDYQLCGYYTLIPKRFDLVEANQFIKSISSKKQRLLGIRHKQVQTLLIAQLARNLSKDISNPVSGDALLRDACHHLQRVYATIGGYSCIAVEYSPSQKLTDFYGEFGFTPIQQNEDTNNCLALACFSDLDL